MSNIFKAMAVVFAIGLSAMYFTTAKPIAEAMTEDESTVMFTIFKRVQNIEAHLKMEVPEDLKFYINCSAERLGRNECKKE